jgi:hypothetical protein
MRAAVVVICGFGWMGCGGSNASSAPTKWMGSARHLRIVGTLQGESIDIDINGAAATDTTNLWCEREYQIPTDSTGQPDYAHGHNAEIRIRAPVTINGQMRLADLGLKRHNYQADAPGTDVPVIPRDDANSPCTLASCTNTNMWLSWTWRNPTDQSVTYKSAAQSGDFVLGEYVGTPDATGLLIPDNTGDIGGFASGQWSATESLAVSFDANCTTTQIDNSY